MRKNWSVLYGVLAFAQAERMVKELGRSFEKPRVGK